VLRWLQSTQRAQNAAPTFVQHMGVDHGGAHIGMAQQLLHRANVVARLQQMRGKRMAQMHAAKTGFEVFLMQCPGLLQLPLQGADQVLGQHHHPVFIALAGSPGVSAAR